VSWAYRKNVLDLDLEPRGPLPSQIYWRRRGLAIGVAVVVIAIVAGISFAVFGGSSDPKPVSAPTTAQGQVPQPENKTPVVAPAQPNPAMTPTPTAAVLPPPILRDGVDCPDSTLAV
jgi:hypothetical protein